MHQGQKIHCGIPAKAYGKAVLYFVAGFEVEWRCKAPVEVLLGRGRSVTSRKIFSEKIQNWYNLALELRTNKIADILSMKISIFEISGGWIKFGVYEWISLTLPAPASSTSVALEQI